MPTKLDIFVSEAKDEMQSLGGCITFMKGKYIGRLKNILGEFFIRNNRPFIRVSVKHPEEVWCSTLVHEYAHFVQWRDGSDKLHLAENAMDIFEEKLFNPNSQVNLSPINDIISFEKEADEIALEIINHYELPIIKEDYILTSNFILFKWLYFKKYGKWPKTKINGALEFKHLMPNHIISSQTIPPEMESKFHHYSL